MSCVALPTATGTGKSGAAAGGAAAVCVLPVPSEPPPVVEPWEARADAEVLLDAFTEAEAEAEAEAEVETEAEADAEGAVEGAGVASSAASLPEAASTPEGGLAEVGLSEAGWPHADARSIAPTAASAAGNLRDEGSTVSSFGLRRRPRPRGGTGESARFYSTPQQKSERTDLSLIQSHSNADAPGFRAIESPTPCNLTYPPHDGSLRYSRPRDTSITSTLPTTPPSTGPRPRPVWNPRCPPTARN